MVFGHRPDDLNDFGNWNMIRAFLDHRRQGCQAQGLGAHFSSMAIDCSHQKFSARVPCTYYYKLLSSLVTPGEIKRKLPTRVGGAVSYCFPATTNNVIKTGSKARQNIRYPVKDVVLVTMGYTKALYSGAIVKLSHSVEGTVTN